ncbi:MAG: hypothetical protein KAT16_06480 [Candidatus Heimdallarchaeota archaeon]|nr:hypothetical protein [Candidatus Heimdallarchaeota archaeon]
MDIASWMSQHVDLESPNVLEVYQGYLIAGKRHNKPICIWLNKQNIEGFTELAKVIAIESSFHGILSFIPGGSFAYRLIKDQIGHPPRFNVIFDPDLYEITFQMITLDRKGQPETIVDTLTQNVENVAKTAVKAGEKIQDTVLGLIKKKKTSSSSLTEEEILGFTYIRFVDAISNKRNQLIKNRIKSSQSRTGKLVKKVITDLTPSIVISYKTTDNEKAAEFLKYLKSIGFNVRFSHSIKNDFEN